MSRKRAKHSRTRHIQKTTLLIVGEGPDDQAFIKHMNRQFRAEAAGIKPAIEKQSGGSPGNIITNATRKYEHQDYDRRFIVLDSDIPISQQDYDKARKHGCGIILWKPTCLEGALLDVLRESVDEFETGQQLKNRLHPRLAAHHTEPEAYAELFPKAVLQSSSNNSVNTVRDLLIR